ncbi:hypothetical protein A3Q56_06230, partial [Intoshia linei]
METKPMTIENSEFTINDIELMSTRLKYLFKTDEERLPHLFTDDFSLYFTDAGLPSRNTHRFKIVL